MSRMRIGELLVAAKVLTPDQVAQALAQQQGTTRRLGDVLVAMGLVNETQLTQTLSQQLSVPWVSLHHTDFSRQLLNLVPRELAEKYCLIPVLVRRVKKQDTLYVAMDDPTNDPALEEIAQATGIPTKPMLACPSDIRAAIRVYYGDGVAPAAAAPSSAEGGPKKPPTIPKPTVPDVSAAARRAMEQAGLGDVVPRPAVVSEPPEVLESLPPEAAEPEEAEEAETPGAKPASAEPNAPKPAAARGARRGAGMLSLTLLDGTTIQLPAKGGKRGAEPGEDTMTARDMVSALRAVAHGADATEILGEKPRWEALFAAVLSLMLRKGLIADWEFVEEYRNV
jgi:type IV pilus assembly protein PilB